MAKVEKSDAQWREDLGELGYEVMRREGTERAGTHDNFPKGPGTYCCRGCGATLFHQDHKYDSGTGWPSFYQPVDGLPSQVLGEKLDTRLFRRRTEVHCVQCDGHLGHVFSDGPQPSGLRYCINGVALRFVAESEVR